MLGHFCFLVKATFAFLFVTVFVVISKTDSSIKSTLQVMMLSETAEIWQNYYPLEIHFCKAQNNLVRVSSGFEDLLFVWAVLESLEI